MPSLSAEPSGELVARALELTAQSPLVTFPIRECLRRGLGRVVIAQKGAVLLVLASGNQLLWAPDTGLGERIVREVLNRDLVTLMTPELAPLVSSTLGLASTEPFHLAIYQRGDSPTLSGDALAHRGCVRVLDEGYASTVHSHYGHPDYVTLPELRQRLSLGWFLGGFDEDDDLVGFIGGHEEGSMGMLEVFEGHRREGWATALEASLITRQMAWGWTPWAQIFEGNVASIALQERLGLTVTPAWEQCFLS